MFVFVLCLFFTINKQLKSIGQEIIRISDISIPGLMIVSDINQNVSNLRREQFAVILYNNSGIEKKNTSLSKIDGYYSNIDSLILKYSKIVDGNDDKYAYNELKKSWLTYKNKCDDFDNYINSNNIKLAGDILEHSYNNFIDMDAKVNNLYKVNVGYTQKNNKKVSSEISSAFYVSIISFSILAILFIIINIILNRQIINPLTLINNLLEEISKGNLTYKFDRTDIANDEFGKLADISLLMKDNLLNLIEEIRVLVLQLNSSVDDVSSVAQQSSTGMQEQQNQVILIATAMEQMRVTVAEVAHNTEKSSSSASDINNNVKQGISDSSLTISEIEKASIEINRAEGIVSLLEKGINKY